MISHYLEKLYQASIETKINQLIDSYRVSIQSKPVDTPFSEQDVVLITYGDSLKRPAQTPMQTLNHFADTYLQGVISTIHILPFYPYSSDDGFSVIDFYAVDPDLGSWTDVDQISQHFKLMFDAVFNHMSAESVWFKNFLADDPDYLDMFVTADPHADLSDVTRPRATPLLTPFEKPNGETVHVWTTFSDDQVDINFKDTATLLRMLDVLLFYVANGAEVIRLDAIAYLWKEIGTTCIHLEQTHQVIQLMRAVLDQIAPHVIFITETNVPHQENISYFGDGTNEAQLVYNFTLPPLLFHTMLSSNTTKLREWVNTLETPSDRTTFFNFTASHDGIGVRPVEGILEPAELQALINHTESHGGQVSYKRNPDGTQSPYELNITYVDAVIDPRESQADQVKRFLITQGMMLALAGVPAIYIHSLLGSQNDLARVAETGRARSINRAKLAFEEVEPILNDPATFRAQVFQTYRRLITVRREHAAFHPNAEQVAIDMNNPAIFAILRTHPDEQILAIYNVSSQPQKVNLSRFMDMPTQDLISKQPIGLVMGLAPYQMCWVVTG